LTNRRFSFTANGQLKLECEALQKMQTRAWTVDTRPAAVATAGFLNSLSRLAAV